MSTSDQIPPGYLRVTEVLAPFSGLHKVPAHFVENAALRGTRVHEICEAIVAGLGKWDITDEVAGYVESFERWWQPSIKVLALEDRFYDHNEKITGKVDLIIDLHGRPTIIDIKTASRFSKTWPVQGAAYAGLASAATGLAIEDVIFLHLDKHGAIPTLHEMNAADIVKHAEIFYSCLDAARYFAGEADGIEHSH